MANLKEAPMISRRSVILLACFATTLFGAVPAAAQSSPVTAELRKILDLDQNQLYPKNVPSDSAAMVAFFTAEWNKHFKPRQDRVAEIIRNDLLTSGEDFFIAGMIFNHGLKPEDNLIAHALLTVAAFKGHPDAKWASAAAMDNYLAGKGLPQLFGTVYGEKRDLTREPMTDALRAQFCVPSLAKQVELASLLKGGRRARFDREKVACSTPAK
jgi:hypothetical protein